MALNLKQQLESARIKLMRSKQTGFYSGIMMLGKCEIVKGSKLKIGDKELVLGGMTAATDGINEYYGSEFMGTLSPPKQRWVVIHETKHKADKHMFRFADLMKKDAQLANAAMDYAINDEIMQIKERLSTSNDHDERELLEFPEGGLWDIQFRNWHVREIFRFLETGKPPQQPPPPQGGKGPPQGGNGMQPPPKGGKPKRDKDKVTIGGKDYPIGGGFDEHISIDDLPISDEAKKELEKKLDEAIRESALLAGLNGTGAPRGMLDAVEPPVDWKGETAEFATAHIMGKDEYTYRQFDRRRLPFDMFLPSTYSERLTEMIVGVDLSGSIGNKECQEWFGALYAICQTCKPEMLRILWWDTNVNSEQVFEHGQYEGLLELLKPMGGGGTRVSCMSDYIVEKGYKPDCCIVFTDGYVESNIDWQVTAPTLWLIKGNDRFVPPVGQKVKVNM